MDRYSVITDKYPREIVLLKGYPCAWGKCSFCDYTEDNSTDKPRMLCTNREVLSCVTGSLGRLEVINSGSCFELPEETLEEIRMLVREKQIRQLVMESHWMYRRRLEEMRNFMGVPVLFKIGVETFHHDFRQKVLNKNADFGTAREVSAYFDSACLLVGIKGQTREMIEEDVHLLKKHFKRGTINLFTENTTSMEKDEELIRWFMEQYGQMEEDPAIEVLYENTDFGVGNMS